jgi:EAL and modified HD-GYP domain-containing signal transduction protein
MDVFVARQPIFNRKLEVFAYELLFRSSGVENFFPGGDSNRAASSVISNSAFLFGLETLTAGKRGFINVTRDVLLKDYVSFLPKEIAVIEVLETVKPDREVIAACRRLKEAGYLLALDDFVYDDGFKNLFEHVDIIKVDFLGTSPEERRNLVQRLGPWEIEFLAEKVETQKDFDLAVSLGYAYFQGYFFSKPVIVQGKDIPGFKLNYLQILKEIHRPELNLDQIEEIIKREVSLSYKLLRYINSPFFRWRQEVSSIRHALILMGDRNVKKWVSFVILAGMGEDRPQELITGAVVRARFCELIASMTRLRNREEDLFLMGMFSLIDAIVNRPLSELLMEIPIADDVKNGLLGEQNAIREIFDVVVSYERGDWKVFSERAATLGINESEIAGLYLQSLIWAGETTPHTELKHPLPESEVCHP